MKKTVSIHPSIEQFSNFQSRILNITHNDLDGAVSAIVIKHVYPNSTAVVTSHSGPQYRNAITAIENSSAYDSIVITDFCPDDEMVKVIHAQRKNYLVLDHHQTAIVRRDDETGNYVIVEGICGAMLAFEYFTERLSSIDHLVWAGLQELCAITNDHDLWLRKMVPLSDDVNTLFAELGFDNFIRTFFKGINPTTGIPDGLKKLLANHDRDVTEYLNSCTTHTLPHNGLYIDCDRYTSDINLRLTPMYDWLVMASTKNMDPGMTGLSFRTRRNDINIGATLKSFGRGGGGHPAAAGQVIPTAEKDEFIQAVGDKLFT